jgi:hypothetical protein
MKNNLITNKKYLEKKIPISIHANDLLSGMLWAFLI